MLERESTAVVGYEGSGKSPRDGAARVPVADAVVLKRSEAVTVRMGRGIQGWYSSCCYRC